MFYLRRIKCIPRYDAVGAPSEGHTSEEIARLKEEALRKQQKNNADFMNRLRREEEMIVSEARQRKRQEELDAQYARQLQNCEERSAVAWERIPTSYADSSSPRANSVRVRCPPGTGPGDCVTLRVPGVGLVSTRVPPGVRSDAYFVYHYDPDAVVLVKFTCPRGLGRSRRIKLSAAGAGEYEVTVPPGVQVGESVTVRLATRKLPRAKPVTPASPLSILNSQPLFRPTFARSSRETPQPQLAKCVRSKTATAVTTTTAAAATSRSLVTSPPVAPEPLITIGEEEEEEEEEETAADVFSGMSVRESTHDDDDDDGVLITLGASRLLVARWK